MFQEVRYEHDVGRREFERLQPRGRLVEHLDIRPCELLDIGIKIGRDLFLLATLSLMTIFEFHFA